MFIQLGIYTVLLREADVTGIRRLRLRSSHDRPAYHREAKPSPAPRKTKAGAKENQAGRQGKPRKTKLSFGGNGTYQTLTGQTGENAASLAKTIARCAWLDGRQRP